MVYYLRRIVFVITIISMVTSLVGCYYRREKEYYSDINNFVAAEGIIDKIKYSEDDEKVLIYFCEHPKQYSDNKFVIKGDNYRIVRENGISDKIVTGDLVNFISAPRIFGDGYAVPIVQLSINGEELLRFEEGYKNLMVLYHN